MNGSGGNCVPANFGLKLPEVKAKMPNQKRHDGKAVSHRNCAHRTQKSRWKKSDNCVSEISYSCCIPLSGASRLSRKKRKKEKKEKEKEIFLGNLLLS